MWLSTVCKPSRALEPAQWMIATSLLLAGPKKTYRTYAGPFSTSFSMVQVTVVPLTLALAPVMVNEVAEL